MSKGRDKRKKNKRRQEGQTKSKEDTWRTARKKMKDAQRRAKQSGKPFLLATQSGTVPGRIKIHNQVGKSAVVHELAMDEIKRRFPDSMKAQTLSELFSYEESKWDEEEGKVKDDAKDD